MAAERAGWLQREEPGVVGRSFRKRWCVLQDNTLFVHKDDKVGETREPVLTVHGEDITAVNAVVRPAGTLTRATKLHVLELATRHATEVFASDDEKEWQTWLDSLKALVSSQGDGRQGAKGVRYATVEVFVVRGVRVAGEVQPHILAELGTTGAKKFQDERGWFCDRFASPSEVLNVMSQNGWQLAAAFGGDAASPIDNKQQPIHSFLFRKA